jgi:ribose transport system substrate-binding protein
MRKLNGAKPLGTRRPMLTASLLLAATAVLLPSGGKAQDLSGKHLVYIQGAKLPFYGAIACGVIKAAEANNVPYRVESPDTFTPTEQIPIVEAVVATKPDVILISPNDTTALIQPLREAKAKGIQVITVANSLAEDDFVTSRVTSDSEKNGATGADLLAKLLGDKGGKVVFLTYQPGGSAIVDARQRGFEARIKVYKNIQYLGAEVVGASYEDGARVANAVLSAHPDLAGAVGSFQFASVSMALSLRERGLVGKVALVGLDAGEEDVEQLKLGNEQGLVADAQRKQGEEGVLQAVNLLSGKPVDKMVTTDVRSFTSANDPDLKQFTYSSDCSAGK